MRAKTQSWRERVAMLLCALVVLSWIACGTPSLGQDAESEHSPITHEDLVLLVEQSEADSLRIKELEIALFYAQERQKIAEDQRPNWVERFFSRYGFAIGAAAGVYVGAAAAR